MSKESLCQVRIYIYIGICCNINSGNCNGWQHIKSWLITQVSLYQYWKCSNLSYADSWLSWDDHITHWLSQWTDIAASPILCRERWQDIRQLRKSSSSESCKALSSTGYLSSWATFGSPLQHFLHTIHEVYFQISNNATWQFGFVLEVKLEIKQCNFSAILFYFQNCLRGCIWCCDHFGQLCGIAHYGRLPLGPPGPSCHLVYHNLPNDRSFFGTRNGMIAAWGPERGSRATWGILLDMLLLTVHLRTALLLNSYSQLE